MGLIRSAPDAAALAKVIGVPAPALTETLHEVNAFAAGDKPDPFGRDFSAKPSLVPPFHAIRVSGTLFHTQGGLSVDGNARVLREDHTPLPNLYAGGGAACGVSGSEDWGYLSGNGLLTAVTLGFLAGRQAARQVESD